LVLIKSYLVHPQILSVKLNHIQRVLEVNQRP